MAEETKKPIEDIEIDTDDVRQEDLTVEVKESANNVDKKEPAPNLNFGEVDLGGTDTNHEPRTRKKNNQKLRLSIKLKKQKKIYKQKQNKSNKKLNKKLQKNLKKILIVYTKNINNKINELIN